MDNRPFRLRPIPFKIIAVWTRAKRCVTSEPLTAWLGVAFTLALAVFTWALVNVASRQTKILKHTDTALNLAAAAQTASTQTAEKLRRFTEATDRAWIGPVSARSDPFAVGKPIKIGVSFMNTGRVLASYEAWTTGLFYIKDEWNGGKVSTDVSAKETECFNGMPHINSGSKLRGVAYPTTGFSSYTLSYNSANPNIPEDHRLIFSLVDAGLIYVFTGCFVYKTGKSAPHHSFYCYFHEAGISEDINNLSFCPFGQNAD